MPNTQPENRPVVESDNKPWCVCYLTPHFKTKILKNVGGWDPYNVTEDADLGIRLFREGYRCATLKQPTYEEAPPCLAPWVSQRTRWIKGWTQTILVHSRHPGQLARDIGIKNLVSLHLILSSVVLSALIHPLFLFASLHQLYFLGSAAFSGFDAAILAGSVFNLVGGYTTYGLLALAVLQTTRKSRKAKLLLTLPLYWLLISYAGWRALWHLLTRPHQWEKTPHGLANQNFSLHKKEDFIK